MRAAYHYREADYRESDPEQRFDGIVQEREVLKVIDIFEDSNLINNPLARKNS